MVYSLDLLATGKDLSNNCLDATSVDYLDATGTQLKSYIAL
jgi:hypothetical protein